jgi:hypothetical protein
METIVKEVKVVLTKEEIESPNPIQIILTVKDEEGESVSYTITYPKGT